MARGLLGKATLGLQYLINKNGPLVTVPAPLGAMLRSDPSQPDPDLFYQIQPWSQDSIGAPLHDFPAFTVSVSNLKATSRGSVHITASDAMLPPAIATNYLSTAEDQEMAKTAIQLTRKIVSAPALQGYVVQEAQADDDLLRLAGTIAYAGTNPVGTCKMGRADDADAVVDNEFRVLGVAGLRVADASVMPLIPAGDTGATTIMLAEKAAKLIRATR